MTRHLWLILIALAMLAVATAYAGDHPGSKCTMSTQDCLDHMAASMKNSGWVGVELETDNPEGYTVTKVMPGSPAEAAGIQAGDILVALNGVAFKKENEDELKQARKDWKPGQTVTYDVKRGGGVKQVSLTLAPWPADVIAKAIGQHMLDHANADTQIAKTK